LPHGWTYAGWDEIGFSQNGRAFPSSQYQSEGVKLLRPGNLHASGTLTWTEANTRYMPHEWERDHPDCVVGAHELVINLTAQSLKDEFLGRVCITGQEEHCLLNQRLARLTPIIVRPDYMLIVFKSRLFRRFVDGLNSGAMIQHMFTSQLVDFSIPLPPLAEQERIVAEVERRIAKIAYVETQVFAAIEQTSRLRNSLFHHALSGKLIEQLRGDEPAKELLARIRIKREKRLQKPKRPELERKAKMKKLSLQVVKEAISKLPKDRFSFDALNDALQVKYDPLKDIIFELLGEPQPVLRQVFDSKAKTMQLERIKS
jgi:type I restriction enzyme S subunit